MQNYCTLNNQEEDQHLSNNICCGNLKGETSEMFKKSNKKFELHTKEGNKVKIVDLPPVQQVNCVNAIVEVKENEKGSNTNIIFYKSTNSINITKMKSTTVDAVEYLANDILKPHILSVMRGETPHHITLNKTVVQVGSVGKKKKDTVKCKDCDKRI